MFSTIEGIYQNGAIILTEPAPIKENCEALITFKVSQIEPISTTAIRGDYAKELISYIAPDFNDSIDDMFNVLKDEY